jgi:predicted dehydrogenase
MLVLDRKIIVVGLGIAGQSHVRALEQLPDLRVIAGIDPDPSVDPLLVFRGDKIPVYREIMDAARRHDPHIVVVATPTSTHEVVCQTIGEHFPNTTVLLEKPASDNLPAAQRLLGKDKPKVHVALHMAFSPEVRWALRQVRERPSLFEVPTAIQSSSTDPYQSDFTSAKSRLSNSWVDSGINALSVIDQFAKVVDRRSLRRLSPDPTPTFEGIFACQASGNGLDALVLTSWNGADRARMTRITYKSGAELVMNHNSVEGYVLRGGQVVSIFHDDSDLPRRERHYRALYQSWLLDNEPISALNNARLHELLLRP